MLKKTNKHVMHSEQYDKPAPPTDHDSLYPARYSSLKGFDSVIYHFAGY